jgi:hypothetical protein
VPEGWAGSCFISGSDPKQLLFELVVRQHLFGGTFVDIFAVIQNEGFRYKDFAIRLPDTLYEHFKNWSWFCPGPLCAL